MSVPIFSSFPSSTFKLGNKAQDSPLGKFPNYALNDGNPKRKVPFLCLICLLAYVIFLSALIFKNQKMMGTCPQGYTMYTPTGKCLKVFRHPQTLHKASLTCLEDQAFVASIGDVQENEFIVKLYKESTDNLTEEPSAEDSKDSEPIHPKVSNFWLGLIHLNNKWLWLDRSAVKFTNWEKGMPENHKEEKCVVVEIKDGKWKNVNCHLKRSVVCEKEPMH